MRRPKPRPRTEWTEEQWALVLVMRAAGRTMVEMAQVIGLPRSAIQRRIAREYPNPRKIFRITTYKNKFVPDEVVAERDARKRLQPRDLTAAFFGDPLPGYSALDRRKR